MPKRKKQEDVQLENPVDLAIAIGSVLSELTVLRQVLVHSAKTPTKTSTIQVIYDTSTLKENLKRVISILPTALTLDGNAWLKATVENK